MTTMLNSPVDCDTIIRRLQNQLMAEGVREYLLTARRLGHGLQVVLFVSPEGKTTPPKVSIDSREAKR